MEFENLQRLYGGRWIAIRGEEEVVATADSYQELTQKISGKVRPEEVSIRFIRMRR